MGIGRQRAASLGDMRARVGVTLAEWSDVPSMDCWASNSLSQSTHLASPIPTGWESGVFVFLIYFGSIRTPGTTGRGEDRAGHRLRESTVVTPLCRNVSYVRFLAVMG